MIAANRGSHEIFPIRLEFQSGFPAELRAVRVEAVLLEESWCLTEWRASGRNSPNQAESGVESGSRTHFKKPSKFPSNLSPRQQQQFTSTLSPLRNHPQRP